MNRLAILGSGRVRFVSFLLLLSITAFCMFPNPSESQEANVSGNQRWKGFDVVSIRPSRDNSSESDIVPRADGYDLRNTSLIEMIAIAYDLREDQVIGLPSWAKSTRFDVLARISDPKPGSGDTLSWPERRSFLLAVLKERFRLRSHLIDTSRPIYLLKPVSTTNKLQRAEPITTGPHGKQIDTSLMEGDIVVTDRFMKGNGVPVALLAKNLGLVLQRDVVDATGYKGLYNISLQWIPYDAPVPQGDTFDVRSELFDALRNQLGLKLEKSRGNVQMVKVNGVEMPSPN